MPVTTPRVLPPRASSLRQSLSREEPSRMAAAQQGPLSWATGAHPKARESCHAKRTPSFPLILCFPITPRRSSAAAQSSPVAANHGRPRLQRPSMMVLCRRRNPLSQNKTPTSLTPVRPHRAKPQAKDQGGGVMPCLMRSFPSPTACRCSSDPCRVEGVLVVAQAGARLCVGGFFSFQLLTLTTSAVGFLSLFLFSLLFLSSSLHLTSVRH